ncbi:hypothetical protein QBC46DRAFT_346235 [Diplogelasinospora grovesii]|uniref:Uncharacterized protein n=1 Tax=Diplogelasinospora grovesii TaxID=303347 RepID=A0AAN6MYM6_9PEZI|nr:hypothetical protein QBC46DRAFT_346235 [Diplogelasinospora grovesii]
MNSRLNVMCDVNQTMMSSSTHSNNSIANNPNMMRYRPPHGTNVANHHPDNMGPNCANNNALGIYGSTFNNNTNNSHSTPSPSPYNNIPTASAIGQRKHHAEYSNNVVANVSKQAAQAHVNSSEAAVPVASPTPAHDNNNLGAAAVISASPNPKTSPVTASDTASNPAIDTTTTTGIRTISSTIPAAAASDNMARPILPKTNSNSPVPNTPSSKTVTPSKSPLFSQSTSPIPATDPHFTGSNTCLIVKAGIAFSCRFLVAAEKAFPNFEGWWPTQEKGKPHYVLDLNSPLPTHSSPEKRVHVHGKDIHIPAGPNKTDDKCVGREYFDTLQVLFTVMHDSVPTTLTPEQIYRLSHMQPALGLSRPCLHWLYNCMEIFVASCHKDGTRAPARDWEMALSACQGFEWAYHYRNLAARLAYRSRPVKFRVAPQGYENMLSGEKLFLSLPEQGHKGLIGGDVCGQTTFDMILATRGAILTEIVKRARECLNNWLARLGNKPCRNLSCNSMRQAALCTIFEETGLCHPANRAYESWSIHELVVFVTEWQHGKGKAAKYAGTCMQCKGLTATSHLFPIEDLLTEITWGMKNMLLEHTDFPSKPVVPFSGNTQTQAQAGTMNLQMPAGKRVGQKRTMAEMTGTLK